MTETVKKALRITHNMLDSDIQRTIGTARSEMIRAGILADKAESDEDLLVQEAIITYCLWVYREDDRYFQSWQYQLDNLRKSAGYGYEVEV